LTTAKAEPTGWAQDQHPIPYNPGSMQMILSDREVSFFRLVCIAILLASAACYAIFTIHWPWMWDTQVFHYAVFLMHHGKIPYKDIYDINMPGCYLMERWAIAIFGGGDLGWRFYEFTLLGSMTLAACVIALPYDWLAGLLTGVCFAIFHGVHGAAMATERDEVIAVLIFVGYAFQFVAVRKSRAIWMLPFGLSLGMAVLIKPTAASFSVVLLLFAYLALKQRAQSPTAYLLWGIAGFGITLLILLSFMLPDSLGPFLFLQREAIPFYTSLAPASWGYLLEHILPVTVLFFVSAAVVLAIANPGRANWEIWSVRAGVVLGALSYLVQRKGYVYHRYPFMAFALLWFSIECVVAIRAKGWLRNIGVLGIAVAVLVVLPSEVNRLRHERHNSNPFADQLQADLQRLGGSSLQNRVQCLDMVTGCYSALYRLGIVQSTGFMGDTLFFAPNDGKSVPYYRKMYWDDMHNNPPEVIVLSSERFGAQYSFDKLNAWPQFRDYLNSAYTLYVSRSFGSFSGNVLAYRIYVLK
jgi:hypothetical protein